MTFIAAFYNFAIELTHSDRGVFESFRVKTPRHETESIEHLYARMIAFCHAYRPGQEFTQGFADPKEPTIWLRDAVGDVLLWIQVGVPDKRKLELSLKHYPRAEHRVYFFDKSHAYSFCHSLRGSKTNWIEGVQFYQIQPALLQELSAHEISSPHWNITFVDQCMYLDIDGFDLESEITEVDIWVAFQESLREGEHQPTLSESREA